jgi:hypothetical protein
MNKSGLKSKAMTLGNRLSRNMERGAAFVKAWAVVKAAGITLPVRGVSFGSRQKALARLASYRPESVRAFLVSECENPFDKNALAVMVGVQGGRGYYKLGYIPKGMTGVVGAIQSRKIAVEVLSGDVYGARLSVAV